MLPNGMCDDPSNSEDNNEQRERGKMILFGLVVFCWRWSCLQLQRDAYMYKLGEAGSAYSEAVPNSHLAHTNCEEFSRNYMSTIVDFPWYSECPPMLGRPHGVNLRAIARNPPPQPHRSKLSIARDNRAMDQLEISRLIPTRGLHNSNLVKS